MFDLLYKLHLCGFACVVCRCGRICGLSVCEYLVDLCVETGIREDDSVVGCVTLGGVSMCGNGCVYVGLWVGVGGWTSLGGHG